MADEEKKADGEKKTPDDKAPEKKSGGALTKVLATVFGAILAPLIVGIAVKWGDPAVWRKPAAQPTTPAPVLDRGLITPKLSDHFYSYGWSPKLKAEVRDDAVDPALFSYDAATGTLQAHGRFVGALVTRKEHDNYVLTVEYKWGQGTYGPRQDKARWGGVEVHCKGADGQLSRVWMQGYEVLLHEGQAGSVDLRGREDKVKAIATIHERVEGATLRRAYDPRGPAIPVISGLKGVPSLVHALDTPEKIDNVPGFHPPGDPTFPDDWNTVEITCEGSTLHVKVNDKEVNVLTGLNHTRGKILIAPQHAEVAFRRLVLKPL